MADAGLRTKNRVAAPQFERGRLARIRRLLVLMALGQIVFPGCRTGDKKDEPAATELPGTVSAPALISRGDKNADGSARRVTIVAADERGELRSRITLRLDYFPGARPGQATLSACLRPLAPDTVVGSVVCTGRNETRQELRAGHLDQVCPSESPPSRTPRTLSFSFPGCRELQLSVWEFRPELRLAVESL